MGNQRSRERIIKVGIATIHKIANFGSVLQTYALQRCVLALGHDCEVIDYIYPNSYHQQKTNVNIKKTHYFRKIINILCSLMTKQTKRELLFEKFINDNIILSEHQYKTIGSMHASPPNYDIYVSGSDQVWNPKYLKEDTTYLLDFAPLKSKRISYASSFGNSYFDQQYAALYKKHLSAFTHISVREDSGIKIVRDLTNKHSQHVLDPSLLLTSKEWAKLATNPKVKHKYILCYFLGYTFNPQPYADILAKYIKKITGYKLIFITPDIYKVFDPTIRTIYDAGPKEFLGWFANAEIILTSSFHGTSFSVIFNKPFFSLIDNKPNLDCRQKSLLMKLNLNNQLISINSPLPDLSHLNINYDSVNKLLDIERKKSLDFLSNALEV